MDLWKDKKWNAAVIKLQFSSAVKYLLKFELKFKHHVDLSEEKKFVLKMCCVFINFWVLNIWYIVSGKTVFSLQATHWFLHLWVDCNWEDYFHLSLLFCLAGTDYRHLITHTIDKGWLDSVSTLWMQTNKDQISTSHIWQPTRFARFFAPRGSPSVSGHTGQSGCPGPEEPNIGQGRDENVNWRRPSGLETEANIRVLCQRFETRSRLQALILWTSQVLGARVLINYLSN